MRNLMLLILNNLKVTFRKKGNIVIYIILPLGGVLLSLLMYGSSSAGPLKIGFIDNDHGWAASELKEKLSATEGFLIIEVEEDEVSKKLLDFELDAAVIVPEAYSESILGGIAAETEIVSLKGKETTAWVEQLINRHTSSMMLLSAASGGEEAAFDRMLAQVRANNLKLQVISADDKSMSRSMTMNSVGFLIMFTMLGAGFTSGIVLKEKRNRTYHRICSAPVSAKQYIFANSLTGLIICIFQILMIQLAMKFVFRIDTGVEGVHMFIILLMFAFVAVGVGLFITAFSNSSYMAGTLNTLILTPTCMLGGCYWDTALMPDIMQKIGYFTPQRWAIDAVTRMQSGGAFGDITLNLLVLAAFAMALMLIAAFRLSRTDNVQKFV